MFVVLVVVFDEVGLGWHGFPVHLFDSLVNHVVIARIVDKGGSQVDLGSIQLGGYYPASDSVSGLENEMGRSFVGEGFGSSNARDPCSDNNDFMHLGLRSGRDGGLEMLCLIGERANGKDK